MKTCEENKNTGVNTGLMKNNFHIVEEEITTLSKRKLNRLYKLLEEYQYQLRDFQEFLGYFDRDLGKIIPRDSYMYGLIDECWKNLSSFNSRVEELINEYERMEGESW